MERSIEPKQNQVRKMLKYVSNKDGENAVDFETAILSGYAPDGGLYVPEHLPQLSQEQLSQWQDLSYVELAFEILSLFIDPNHISPSELKQLLTTSYQSFEKEEIVPLHRLKTKPNAYIMELFYGPTISFKDIGMAFLVNLINFFLERKKEHLTIIVATTGDTGPAAAHFIAGKSNLEAWVLYPDQLITEQQERQMTTLPHANVHPVAVSNCPNGGDDLDAVISKLYKNKSFKDQLNLSSVNSLNWGRVMMQMVHYFYGYFQVVDKIGEEIHFAVPSGGFGNLCAGSLSRKMGLPVKYFVSANNQNACLHRIFEQGIFSKKDILATLSSAIDILIPINFWRYLYFAVDEDSRSIKRWIETFEETGEVKFDKATHRSYSEGYLSYSISDEQTLKVIKSIYESDHYLLDPHAAVSVAALDILEEKLGEEKLICLATAHPAKFPDTIQKALGSVELPKKAFHPSIDEAKTLCQKTYTCEYTNLEQALSKAMEANWKLKWKKEQ